MDERGARSRAPDAPGGVVVRGHHVRIELRTFPSADEVFGAFAHEALAGEEPRSPAALQHLLRRRYPLAVVRAQDDFARDAPGIVWYAFRFGSANPPSTEWTSVTARATIDSERRFVALNDELAAIVEAPRAAIIGQRIERFTNPEDPTIRSDLAALWQEFLRVGVLVSTLRFNYADGRPRELAFRLVADEDGPGLHRLLVRDVMPEDNQAKG